MLEVVMAVAVAVLGILGTIGIIPLVIKTQEQSLNNFGSNSVLKIQHHFNQYNKQKLAVLMR